MWRKSKWIDRRGCLSIWQTHTFSLQDWHLSRELNEMRECGMQIPGGRTCHTVQTERRGLQAEMNLRDKACVMGRGNKAECGSRWHWRGPEPGGLWPCRPWWRIGIWVVRATLIFLKDFCACCGDWTVEGQKSKQRDYVEDYWSGRPARGGCALRMGQGQR